MISIIAGTNRKNSETLKVANYYEKVLKGRGVDCQVLDLANLPKTFCLPLCMVKRMKNLTRLLSNTFIRLIS